MAELDRGDGAVPAGARPKAEKLRPSLFWPLGAVLVPFIRLGTRLRIHDGDKLPKTGAFVLAPNHVSNLDPVVLAVAVWRYGRAPRFLAKASLFEVPVLGSALRGTGQVPVDRSSTRRGAVPLEAATKLVREGRCVIVYPEGTLTKDPAGWPMRGRSGTVRLALDLDIPVIPVAHLGCETFLPRGKKFPRLVPRTRIDVRFGDPVDLDEWRGRPVETRELQAATERVMSRVTALLAGLRGEEPPAVPYSPGPGAAS